MKRNPVEPANYVTQAGMDAGYIAPIGALLLIAAFAVWVLL